MGLNIETVVVELVVRRVLLVVVRRTKSCFDERREVRVEEGNAVVVGFVVEEYPPSLDRMKEWEQRGAKMQL